MDKGKILVIDDEPAICRTLKEILEYENYTVDVAADGKAGLQQVNNVTYDLIFSDIKMPKLDGMEFLAEAQKITDTPIVMISGHGDIETAVSSLKSGAYDYLAKPLDLNRLLVTVRNAMDRTSLVKETKILRQKVDSKYKMVGESQAIKDIIDMIDKVALTDAKVLITGENGTGKELVAHQLHEKSNRKRAPFIEVNCAAIPSELIESQLFGHEKGSFTSAIKQRKGDFELADGGTLFLDEIGDMSQAAQAKVLRALQENKITHVGGEKEIEVNVRIVAATNKNLKHEIEKGNFREDLYHRLSVILINVPPLRERRSDIPLLANHFLEELCPKMGKQIITLDDEATALLSERPWSGNIRELHNVIERLSIFCDKTITADDVRKYA